MKALARSTHRRMRPPRRRALVLVLVGGLASLGSSACSDRRGDTTPAQSPTPSATPTVSQPPAPFGLRFGMKPSEIPFPVMVAPDRLAGSAAQASPAPPDQSAKPAAGVAAQSSSRPTSLFGAGQAPAPSRAVRSVPAGEDAARSGGTGEAPRPVATASTPLITPVSTEGPTDWSRNYIEACETAFDRTSDLGAGTPEWLGWRAAHLDAGEGKDFADVLIERAEAATFLASTQTRTALDAERSAGLYRFDAADGRRAVCLLFTSEGLAQVFVAGDALSGIRDQIIDRLKERTQFASFTLIHEAERFSLSLSRPACGIYCRLFGERILVERQIWLDRPERVLVATKRSVVASGISGLFAGMGAQREMPDRLPDSFVASIDLTRRAHVLRRMLEPSRAGVVPPHSATTQNPVTPPAAAGNTPGHSEMTRQAVIRSFVP